MIKGHVTPAETAKVQQAIDYIQKNYTTDISLDGLVEEVRLDRKVFRQIFKELTGTTVHAYLVDVRMSRAKEDLANWDLSIDQVAHRNGFRSQSHFTKKFRQLMGIAPNGFRLQLIHSKAHVVEPPQLTSA
ncbi:MAG: hypothetical protein BGO55_08590 [Sphingobacteriales bacterium 50-39]|nr:helix-turn-helix transcriptional regulator [Sphingobacteriales bacterium]OJW59321.1 MAG: hypothetical protein BGO55_08590 [Sphingobacteriales bacterium 50-39]